MTPAKMKKDEEAEATSERIRDVVLIAGLLSVGFGVYLQFGLGWALITVGAVLLALVSWTMRTPHAG